MVINRGLFLSGEFNAVLDEIRAVVEACGDATLKVILEVSELDTYDNVRAASFLAMQAIRAGDFIKTSTGKASGSATLANTQVMIEAIRDFYLATGVAIGTKPAGGIRNAKQALHHLVAVKETLGDAWLNSTRYRFGASSLLNDLLRQIEKEKTGAYQAPYYFTESAESYRYDNSQSYRAPRRGERLRTAADFRGFVGIRSGAGNRRPETQGEVRFVHRR